MSLSVNNLGQFYCLFIGQITKCQAATFHPKSVIEIQISFGQGFQEIINLPAGQIRQT